MAKAAHNKPVSAGVLIWEGAEHDDAAPGEPRVLLAHMGGPFWAHKDIGAWSIPKGLLEPGESPLAGARREFAEETGITLPDDDSLYVDLGEAPGPGGRKVLRMFALAARHVPAAREKGCAALQSDAPPSNTFTLEWPPHSGIRRAFPEIDRLACLPLSVAEEKIDSHQRIFLQRLARRLSGEAS